MKKVLLTLVTLFTIFTVSGCEKVGKYKEGTYFGSVEFESYGQKYVTTAVIYINDAGMIKSVYIDSTYNKDNVNTTKKTLKDDYGMKETSNNIGIIPGGAEWYEQVEVIENKIIEEQNLDWVEWSSADKNKLDSVSGVTITADTYIKAVEIALNQAK